MPSTSTTSNNPNTSTNPQAIAHEAKRSFNDAASGISREFHNFVADIEDLVKATSSLTGDDLAKAKAKLNERIAHAKESLDDVSGGLATRARQTAAITNNYVHEQPWQAIGASAAIGFLLGFALSRRG